MDLHEIDDEKALLFEVHLARHGIKRTPLPGTPTVDKRCSVVHRGVSRDGRFVGGGARNQEPDGDTRCRDSDLDRFRPSDRCNTLRPVSLVYCIDVYHLSSRGPLPLLIYSGGVGLQRKYPIWYYTISCGARRPVPCTP